MAVFAGCFIVAARKVVQPACLILERLAGESFHLVQYDFVDLVYTLLEMAASRYVRRRR